MDTCECFFSFIQKFVPIEMISRFISLAFFSIILACSPVQLTQELNNARSMKLYRNAIGEPDKYNLNYNTDSSFVICMLKDNSEMVSEPVSFLVINLDDKEKVVVSVKEYHRTMWIDQDNILLTKYLGVPVFERTVTGKPGDNRIEYILNVRTKEINQKQRSDQEIL